jgi:hypothetical protein
LCESSNSLRAQAAREGAAAAKAAAAREAARGDEACAARDEACAALAGARELLAGAKEALFTRRTAALKAEKAQSEELARCAQLLSSQAGPCTPPRTPLQSTATAQAHA